VNKLQVNVKLFHTFAGGQSHQASRVFIGWLVKCPAKCVGFFADFPVSNSLFIGIGIIEPV